MLTLLSLTHASSEMYRTFVSTQSLVLRQVLQKEIPLDVQPEAEAVYISSTSPQDLSRFFRFVGTDSAPLCFEQSAPPITVLTAMRLSLMHYYVTFFTRKFCTSILSQNPISGLPDNNYCPPSENEIHRIQRTFYRLELYCNMARREKGYDNEGREGTFPIGQLKQFLLAIPPWELEQLACVRDYCYRKIASPVNRVTLHDVMYGVDKVAVCWDRSYPNMKKLCILSSGLGWVHQLLTSKTYEESKELIDRSTMYTFPFLHEQTIADPYTYDASLSIDDIYYETVIRYEDTFVKGWRENDKGPIAAWRWAANSPYQQRQRQPLLHFYTCASDLRDWAYCIWDHSRLTAWNLFAKPWNGKRARLREIRLHEVEVKSQESLTLSWARRESVFRRGGKHRLLKIVASILM